MPRERTAPPARSGTTIRPPRMAASVAVAIGAALLSFVPTGTARAGDLNGAEQTFLDYRIGIHAAAVCRDIDLDDTDRERLDARVKALSGDSVGPGRQLFLIERSKAVVDEGGCASDAVTTALLRFDQELASALE
jgi:hypothetical protein